jgi:hypothetical protein
VHLGLRRAGPQRGVEHEALRRQARAALATARKTAQRRAAAARPGADGRGEGRGAGG